MVKIKKQRQKNFTIIDNKVLQDTELTLKAKGLFAYLWSQADEWNFYETEVVKHSKGGKPKAFSAYKRAIKKGVTNKKIQTGIVKYLTQIKVQGTTKEYIKNGSTWFNQECWNDEYNLGQEKSPVNSKTVSNSASAERTVSDLEREERESRRDAFPMQYKNHPEWFTDEDVQNIIEEFPELREKVLEIDRARATSDRNTAK